MTQPTPPSPPPRESKDIDIRPLLSVVVTFASAFFVGCMLAFFAAPDHIEVAMITGMVFAAGVGFARYALEVIVLPLVLVAWAWGLLTRGGKPAERKPGRSWDERLAGVIFVLAYTGMALVTGGFVGAVSGGWGIAFSAAVFGVVAMVYAIVVRNIAVDELATVEPQVSVPSEYNRKNDVPPQVITDLAKRAAEQMTRNK